MTKASTSKKDLLELYNKMLLIRRFEEKAGQLYGMGHIGGFCHLYIGQEAVVVGIDSIKENGDQNKAQELCSVNNKMLININIIEKQ